MFGFGRLGPMELILILTVALIVFGPKKLPEIGKALGKALKEFRMYANELQKDLDIGSEVEKVITDDSAPSVDDKVSGKNKGDSMAEPGEKHL